MGRVRANKKLKIFLIAWLMLLAGCDSFTIDSEIAIPEKSEDSVFFHPLADKSTVINNVHAVYVPVYSNIFISGGGKLDLAITLSVRNTDFRQPLFVKSVSYYNTAGKLIEKYLDVPYTLAPMASTHFFVNQKDSRGGAGANFIVQWAATGTVNKPVIEAVMAGSKGTHGIAFINSGREIKDNRG